MTFNEARELTRLAYAAGYRDGLVGRPGGPAMHEGRAGESALDFPASYWLGHYHAERDRRELTQGA